VARVLTESAQVDEPTTNGESTEPKGPADAPEPATPDHPQVEQEPSTPTGPSEAPGSEPDGGDTPDAPSTGPPPEGSADRVPEPVQVECEACGHMNLLTPDTSVYPLAHSESFTTCAECLGNGRVLTGSLVLTNMVETCPRCQGRGYLDSSTGEAPPLLPLDADAPPWEGAVKDEHGTWR
jgi:hypothetical protein